jgi:hypothetical protein
LAGLFGSRLHDEETGVLLGRAFVIPWRGRVLLIGYTGIVPLRPVVRRDPRLNYWKLTLGFSAAREPDFTRQR